MKAFLLVRSGTPSVPDILPSTDSVQVVVVVSQQIVSVSESRQIIPIITEQEPGGGPETGKKEKKYDAETFCGINKCSQNKWMPTLEFRRPSCHNPRG